MTGRRFLLPSLGVALLFASTASAQAPRSAGGRETAQAAPSPGEPSPGDLSILRQDYPFRPGSTYGFRNPGGVGRYAEYYPPGNVFQARAASRPPAEFGNSSALPGNAQEQLEAQRVGVMKYNALQSHIDRYGHPFGYGYGFGAYWGAGFR